MIIFTKQGQRELLPDLAAYDGSLYCFPFSGDETYTDPFDSSVWTWEEVTNDVEEVLGVSQNGTNLILTSSLSDCEALDGTFFWDDANGVLYVHWINSVGDWSVEKQENRVAKLFNGYASGYNQRTNNVYDGQYYDPILTSITGLDVNVDPTKLGLISFDSSTIALADEENNFINLNKEDIVGVPVWIYYTDNSETELKDEDRIFTGILNGIKHNRSSVTFDIIQSRLFENKPVCPNKIEFSEWPNAGSEEGKLKPVAWGDIRRGKVVLVNGDSLSTSSSGSATLLLADPDLNSLRVIFKIYDDEDNEVTIDSSDLNACTATITKPAGVSTSKLKKYKWEGEGYDIDGTYNNGLDIIKDAFLKIASIPFLDSTYDTTQWNLQTLENTQDIGVSLQSNRGFVEDLVEPIMTSLQGVVQTLGDGRISFFNRNVEADVFENIEKYSQVNDPQVEESAKELVSEIVVEYSQDFVIKEPLQVIYEDNTVVGKYGINRRDPVSPVKTLLVNDSDAVAIAEEIAETSTDPQRIIVSEKTFINKDIKIFDIVSIDTGDYGTTQIEYGEVLNISPKYLNQTQSYKIRIVPDYQPSQTIKGFLYSDGSPKYTTHGIDGHGIFEKR